MSCGCMESNPNPIGRRRFLGKLLPGTALVIAGLTSKPFSLNAESPKTGTPQEEEVSPVEDLMREHGVLRRILLIYNEALRKIQANEELPPQELLHAAEIIRSFIEDYHEKLEEDFVFPRFRKAKRLVDLVDILFNQHQAARRLTDTTLRLAKVQPLKDPKDRQDLSRSLELFIRMYNPHAAREDTVLFPTFHKMVNPNEYDELGDAFENKEHQLFGKSGFETIVERVSTIEKRFGIYDLQKFTPTE
ncbi:MAG: hemerythrin domain-containing protein [Candidatus Omnitrophota bacterium]